VSGTTVGGSAPPGDALLLPDPADGPGRDSPAGPGQRMGDGVVASEARLVRVLDEVAGDIVVATHGGTGSIREPTVWHPRVQRASFIQRARAG